MYKTFIKKLQTRFLLTTAFLVMATVSFAQLVGGTTYDINGDDDVLTGTISFKTLASAVTYLNANGVTGSGQVVLQFTTSGTEDLGSATIKLNGAATGFTTNPTSATLGITIRPGMGVTKTITGSVAGTTSIIDFSAVKYITIDGRQNGTGATGLTIQNTNADGVALAFLTAGQSSNVTIQYCELRASTTTITNGVIHVPGRLKDVEITNNNIIGGYNGISLYTTAILDNVRIENNNISSFTNRGIYYYSNNASEQNTVISGNSIYNPSGTAASAGISIAYGGRGIKLQNNYIGGTAPQCSGNQFTTNSAFNAISIASTATLTNASITANTIANIKLGGAVVFSAVNQNANTANAVVNVVNNKIYSIAGGGAALYGIYLNSTATTNLLNYNLVNNVIAFVNSNTGTEKTYGIFHAGGSNTTINCFYNTIYMSPTANANTTSAFPIFYTQTATTPGVAINNTNNILINTFTGGGINSYSTVTNGNATTTYTKNFFMRTGAAYSDISAAGATDADGNKSLKFGTTFSNISQIFTDISTNDYSLNSTSAARAALTFGVPQAAYTTDIIGTTRNAVTTTVGAYDYSEAVLPVNISSFTAKLNNNKVQFNWSAGTETNVNRYEVERLQADGRFVVVATVAANGSLNYGAIDNQPLLGTNYYRLKSVDNDGTAGYFATLREVRVVNLGDQTISIYPNPVVGNVVTVALANYPAAQYTYKIAGVAGNVVQQGQFTNNGFNRITLSQTLAKGVYVLSIANGNSLIQSKLLKN